jgi:hypothetical protein
MSEVPSYIKNELNTRDTILYWRIFKFRQILSFLYLCLCKIKFDLT